MKVSSMYDSAESVAGFRVKYDVSGDFDEDDVVFEPVVADEYVTSVPAADPLFFYMYTHFIKDFHLDFPFSDFQTSMLRTLNVAPTQLSPNSGPLLRHLS
jgi:hypothetical protein